MKHWTNLKTSAALALVLPGSAAFADVSAQDVWALWQEQMGQYGYTIKADESQSGDTLTLNNVAMHIDIPEEGGTVDVTLDQIVFKENGNGTVTMIVPETLPIRLKVDPAKEGEESVDMVMTMTSDDMATVLSGTPDNLTQTMDAGMMGIALSSLIVDGKPVSLGAVNLNMTGVSSQSNTQRGAVIVSKQNLSAQTLDYVIDVTDPEGEGGRVFMKGTLAGLTGTGDSKLPEGIDMQDMAAAMRAGFGFDGGFTHQGGSTEFDITGDGDQMQGKSSTTGGAFRIAMDAGQLIYDVASTGMAVDLMGSDIPLPVSFQMGEAAFKLMMPLSKSDDLQDYQVAITLGDFTMADMLWGIFDPTGQLPRDPATVAVDVSGKVKLTHDLMDEQQMAGLGDTPPGEIHAADINGLTVRAAGAELTGNGGFTFDNTDMVSFDGIPRPEGMMNLRLVGGNGLLDKLVAMGFVPEDQAMGARMMMGLFAIPGEGEDTLTSKIEINAEGHVLANGQRLK